jgi:hypothetical protein
MSEKCKGCGYYTLACQCKKDDNYCGGCNKIISNCSCKHSYHEYYPRAQEYNNNDDNNSYESDKNDDCGGGDPHSDHDADDD